MTRAFRLDRLAWSESAWRSFIPRALRRAGFARRVPPIILNGQTCMPPPRRAVNTACSSPWTGGVASASSCAHMSTSVWQRMRAIVAFVTMIAAGCGGGQQNCSTLSSIGICDVTPPPATEVHDASKSVTATAMPAARWMGNARRAHRSAGRSDCTAAGTLSVTRASAFAGRSISTTAGLDRADIARARPTRPALAGPTPCRRPARRKSGSTKGSRCALPSPAGCGPRRPGRPAPTPARPCASPSAARSRSPSPVCCGGRI